MKKILVIDDHPVIHRELEKKLTSNGYAYIGAFDVMSGLKKAKEAVPDLILLDVMLPGMDGTQVVRSISSSADVHTIPIIFMTVTVSKQEEREGKTMVIDNKSYPVFAKPLHYFKLFAAIEELTQKK